MRRRWSPLMSERRVDLGGAGRGVFVCCGWVGVADDGRAEIKKR